jgi:hypothetical protein
MRGVFVVLLSILLLMTAIFVALWTTEMVIISTTIMMTSATPPSSPPLPPSLPPRDESRLSAVFHQVSPESCVAGRDKFLIFHAMRGGGGLGDRVVGMMNALLLAKLTNRTFLMNWFLLTFSPLLSVTDQTRLF